MSYTGKVDLFDADGKIKEELLPTSVGGLELGETETTAYRGDRGKTAYDHSQSAHLDINSILGYIIAYGG